MGRASLATLAARFEAKVDRSGTCHLWTSPPRSNGYGQINVEGKSRPAHVVAWFLASGQWPPDCVLPATSSEVSRSWCARRVARSSRSPSPATAT